MTLTINQYIHDVVSRMPTGVVDHVQIERELTGHINERLEHGQPLDTVLQQLGDPKTLAGSYLAEVPLVPASFIARGVAKIVDLVALAWIMAPVAVLTGFLVRSPFAALIVEALAVSFSFCIYTAILEWRYSTTLGKWLFDLRVTDESGARIGGGQAIVRQLGLILEVFSIDVLFALFTERHQRAFELLSKTRVVKV
jgi:uncharacterized RDD family membrane protein YckC